VFHEILKQSCGGCPWDEPSIHIDFTKKTLLSVNIPVSLSDHFSFPESLCGPCFGSPDDPGAYPPPGVAVLDAKGGMQRARSAEPSLGLGVQGTDPKPQEDMFFFTEKMKIFFVHIAQQFNNGTF